MSTSSIDYLTFYLSSVDEHWPIDAIQMYTLKKNEESKIYNTAKSFDKDNDDLLSLDEFQLFFSKYKELFQPLDSFIKSMKSKILGTKYWELLMDRYKKYEFIYKYRQKNNDRSPKQSLCKRIDCYLTTGYFSLYDCDYCDPPIDSDRFELMQLLQKRTAKIRPSILNNSDNMLRMSLASRRSSGARRKKSTAISFNSSINTNMERSRLYNMEKSKRPSDSGPNKKHSRRIDELNNPNNNNNTNTPTTPQAIIQQQTILEMRSKPNVAKRSVDDKLKAIRAKAGNSSNSQLNQQQQLQAGSSNNNRSNNGMSSPQSPPITLNKMNSNSPPYLPNNIRRSVNNINKIKDGSLPGEVIPNNNNNNKSNPPNLNSGVVPINVDIGDLVTDTPAVINHHNSEDASDKTNTTTTEVMPFKVEDDSMLVPYKKTNSRTISSKVIKCLAD